MNGIIVMKKVFFISAIFIQNLIIAQTPITDLSLRTKHFNVDKSWIAIQGYDPVNYFLGSPKAGSASYSYQYNGVTYKFVTAKNRELFKTTPSKYEPMYGGWCAYAMGNSAEKVSVDPETFKIVNGKLYLFYNKYFTNTLKDWNKNEGTLKKNADLNWPKLFK